MSRPIYAYDQPAEWRVILADQQDVPHGAHRWEAVNMNGWAVFNNGEDLPATYRVGDEHAIPIYELREQGIAYVGTIGETNGILMCGCIGEIEDEKLAELFTMVGGVAAVQPGATYSGDTLTTGVMASGVATVTASTAIFTAAMVGRYVWFQNGFHKKITALVGASPSTQVTLEAAPTFAITAQPFFIVNENTDYTVTAVSNVFTSAMVGLKVLWADGATRTITEYVDARNVKVDMYVGHPSATLQVENAATYAAYQDNQFVNEIGYKVIWSMPGEPRRFAAQMDGSITRGSRQLTLKYPMKSLEAGQQIVIAGAGVAGGNHTTTIQYIYAANTRIRTTTAANTTVVDAAVMRADAVGSIVGGYEIQDDGSRVVRIKKCRGDLVVYKETGIYLGKYSGLVAEPFAFKNVSIPQGNTLYYPWTLIEVEGLYHIFAGKDAFYRFDMTSQLPDRLKFSDECDNLFFSVVTPEQKDYIWSADNVMTKEVLIVWPSATEDKGLYIDYKHNTASTTTAAVTAAGMCKRPFSNLMDDWFVMGNSQGTVLTYGLMNIPWPNWEDERDIYYRRDAFPYNSHPRDYIATLASGLADFGDAYNEKDWLAWIAHLASQEQDLEALQLTVEFWGSRNVSEAPTLLGSKLVTSPKTNCLVPVWFSQHLLQDRIKVQGMVRCILSARTWEVAGVRTKSVTRRE